MDKLFALLVERLARNPKILEDLGKRLLDMLLARPEIMERLLGKLMDAVVPQGERPGNPEPPTPPAPPTPKPTKPRELVAMVGEMWHDWFKDSTDDESDYISLGHPRLEKILQKVENVPPGASVMFETRENDEAGDYVINHIFTYRGKRFVIPSDTKAETQSWPGLGHIQYGQRGWQGHKGWGFILRLYDPRGKSWSRLTYHSEDPATGAKSNVVHLVVANAGA